MKSAEYPMAYLNATLPALRTGNYALFLDLDGTLAEIATTPQAAFIPTKIIEAVKKLHHLTDQALAIISGRTLADIDNLCGGLRLTAAGQHGLELRYPDGHLMQVEGEHILQLVKAGAITLQQQYPSLLLEFKSMGLAVHYRQAPELADMVQQHLQKIVAVNLELQLQQGKMVSEVRLTGANKGTAIAELMSEKPFIGKTPIFIGDDVTDEDGFTAVNQLGGISVKIGPGDTGAQCHLQNVAQLHGWLYAQAEIDHV